MIRIHWVIAAIIFWGLAVGVVQADRYCGIYAVYGAACSLGKEADFESMVNERYVSGYGGSTINNLQDALESIGLEGTPVWRLSAATLEKAEDPLILHVTSEGQLISYNHWMLYLGQENGMAKIAEGEQGVVTVPLANVLARWDGVAIAVHQQAAAKTPFNQVEFQGRVYWLLFAALVLAPFAFVKIPGAKRWMVATIGIAAIAIAVCAIRHVISPDGFANNRRTLAYIDAAYTGGKFGTISMSQIKEAIQGSDPVPFTVIDARYENDFRMGAVPGAINIPISANSGLIRKLTKDLDREKPLVVYCQSSGCSFDRVVAILLVGQGFKDIRLCSGGWVDWNAEESEIKP